MVLLLLTSHTHLIPRKEWHYDCRTDNWVVAFQRFRWNESYLMLIPVTSAQSVGPLVVRGILIYPVCHHHVLV